MKRRDFIAAGSACLAAPMLACSRKSGTDTPSISFNDGGLPPELGHRLRDAPGSLATPTETRHIPVLIVGGGIAGLSAAWWLNKSGFNDFTLFELGGALGGNSRFGENPVSRYPLGAHNLPLPPREAVFVRELLADLGAIERGSQSARPAYNERLLCHTPQERVYFKGFWQDGVLPHQHLTGTDRDDIERFLAQMAKFRHATDAQGRRAFALPLDLSSPDPRWRALDLLTMQRWMQDAGYRSPVLYWYVDYACRDDFGTGIDHASAWAGIHYFACRNGQAANASDDAVLTAPEGNGWIVRALETRLAPHLQRNTAALRITQNTRRVQVDAWLPSENRLVRYECDQLIWAAPLFMLPRIAPALPDPLSHAAQSGSYAPWLLASLTLREAPAAGAGAPPAWDNVLYGGKGLGYIDATHQTLRVRSGKTVWTWYHAMTDAPPAVSREKLLTTPPAQLANWALDDLSRAHHDLRALTEHVALTRHGHAMHRPTPGTLWHSPRHQWQSGWGRVRFAHADLSGLSLFEEANYHGVQAARAVLRTLISSR